MTERLPIKYRQGGFRGWRCSKIRRLYTARFYFRQNISWYPRFMHVITAAVTNNVFVVIKKNNSHRSVGGLEPVELTSTPNITGRRWLCWFLFTTFNQNTIKKPRRSTKPGHTLKCMTHYGPKASAYCAVKKWWGMEAQRRKRRKNKSGDPYSKSYLNHSASWVGRWRIFFFFSRIVSSHFLCSLMFMFLFLSSNVTVAVE